MATFRGSKDPEIDPNLGAAPDCRTSPEDDERRAAVLAERSAQARVLDTVGLAASGLVHDLANPLQIIMSMTEMVLLAPDDPEHVREHAQAIGEAAALMQRLTRRYIEYARPSPAKPLLTRLSDVIDGVLPLLRAIARQRGGRVETRYADDGLCARVRPREVQQVLVSVVQSACALASEVDTGQRPEPVLVKLVRHEGVARITVEARRSSTSTIAPSAHELTGAPLSLAVARDILTEHGGRISIDEAVAERSSVHVDLPLPSP